MNAFLFWVGLVRRELLHYFVTPIAYIILGGFWMASGYFFSFNALFVGAIEMVTAFHNMSLLLLLMVPLISMRTIAEERQSGTLELLLTLPVGETAVVTAKYGAMMIIVFLMLLGSSLAVVALALLAEPDFGPIIGGYCGVFLLASAFAAIGVMISSFATNQIVAAVITWILLLFLWFVDYLSSLALPVWAVELARHMSFSLHYLDLIRGVLSSASVALFISVVVVSLVIAIQALKLRRV